MKKKLKNQKGFTLIESILSTVVMTVGLWGGIAMFQGATLNSTSSGLRVMASDLASQQMEQIIADKAFIGYNNLLNANYPQQTLTAPNNNFTRIVNITEVDSNDLTTPQAGSGYKRIDVTISWGNQPHQNISVSSVVTTYT